MTRIKKRGAVSSAGGQRLLLIIGGILRRGRKLFGDGNDEYRGGKGTPKT
jgi:hypothetical protein